MINLWYWVLAILLFGVLVMLHEFGHFIAARLTGVTVREFAVGFGPKLLSRQAKSGVRYSLRALPFGGYCRFVGDEEGDEARPDQFKDEKIWKRALISLSGPLMNVLTAFLLLFLLYFAIGLPYQTEPVVDSFMPGLPAESAGFAVGDRILRINGIDIQTTEEASEAIAEAGGQEITFDLERDGAPVTVTVQPLLHAEEEGATPRYMIGIYYRMGSARMTFGVGESLQGAWSSTWQMARLVVDVLRDLIFRGEGLDELSGPIGTVTVVKEQTQTGGLFSYVYLAAIISVNLGLFNLLPVPGLDGSRLLFLLLEKIRGKPLDPNKEGIITLIGFALLMGVMLLALYQDIARLLR